MTEKQMRALVRAYCAELDAARARQSVRAGLRRAVVPTALGAGLLLSSCVEPTPIPQPYLAIPPCWPGRVRDGGGCEPRNPPDGGQPPSAVDGGAEQQTDTAPEGGAQTDADVNELKQAALADEDH